MTVTTRFAPSPTGFLHIGGARTALYNWLFARHHGGTFLLRIEDTDKKRSTQEAIDALQDGLDWLGISSDEPPVFQSQRAERHIACAMEMVERGTAFKCYVPLDELSARKERAQNLLADIKSGNLSDEDAAKAKIEANELLAAFRSPYRNGAKPPSPDAPFVIRLKAPDDGEIVNNDEVQGRVAVAAKDIDDLVLVRADGNPTYMLAVVVDDHDMNITHVIRGDDHLTNTFRQIPIYQGLGWELPVFAHIPLLHGPDGKKISKRDGAIGVEEYRDLGYVPEGLKNYLLRLGWAHGNEEFITEEEAIELFSLDGVNKAAARMDFDKLAHINSLHMRAQPLETLLEGILPFIEGTLTNEQRERVRSALPSLAMRTQLYPELAAATDFLVTKRPIDMNAKARKKLKGDGLANLSRLANDLKELTTWDSGTLEEAIKTFCEANDLGLGQVGPALRTALTGGRPAPDLHLILAWLGRDEALGRIDDAVAANAT